MVLLKILCSNLTIYLPLFRIPRWFGEVRVFLGLLGIALCGLSCAIDYHLYHYFTEVISQMCLFPAGSTQCYCESSKSTFDSYFGYVGPLNCHNPASRNRHLLASNAMFSLLSLIILVVAFSNVFVAACSRAVAAAMEYRVVRSAVSP